METTINANYKFGVRHDYTWANIYGLSLNIHPRNKRNGFDSDDREVYICLHIGHHNFQIGFINFYE